MTIIHVLLLMLKEKLTFSETYLLKSEDESIKMKIPFSNFTLNGVNHVST